MKKLTVLILVAISLFSMVVCDDTTEAGPYVNYDYEDKDARDEAIYRQEYVLRLSEEPEKLAEFLFVTDRLDEFVEVDTEDRSKTIENAVAVFSKYRDVHQEALEKAREVLAEVHIDCELQSQRSDDFETYEEYETYMEQNHPTLPLATNAEGEPISNKPAGPWDGPTD